MTWRGLIIANGRFDDESFTSQPENAETAAELKDRIRNWIPDNADQFWVLIDETKESLESAIARFFRRANANDQILLFYTGYLIRNHDGNRYLATVDTDNESLKATALSIAWIRQVILSRDLQIDLHLCGPNREELADELRSEFVTVHTWDSRALASKTFEDQLGTTPSESSYSPHPPPPREHVDWVDDDPADTDLLRRDPLAQVLAARLRRVTDGPHRPSFLVHVDGPWGSGKSTLLNLLAEELSPTHLVVHYNAWRNARVQPPWWSLLTTIRDRIIKDRPRLLRPVAAVRETWARTRRGGSPFFLAIALTAGAIAALYLLLPPLSAATVKTTLSTVTATAAAVGILWSASRIAVRLLLWNSSRGAQLLERSHTDPMGEVSAHFGWLVAHSRRPVVVFIDDLDRCDSPTVIEILEAIQTLARDQPEGGGPAAFVVAADGAWLRRAYEDHYTVFDGAVDQPGQPLGYLFQEKLFQLSVPIPAVGDSARAGFLGRLLGNPRPPERDLTAEQQAVSRRIAESSTETEVLQALRDSDRQVRQNLAPQAALKLTEPAVTAETEHTLEKFAPRLQTNPRGVKRFLNTYSILRTLRTLEGNAVATDTLAAWALLRSRWPQLADHLEARPQDLALFRIQAVRELPKPLRSLATAPELREFLSAADVALNADDIQRCCGMNVGAPVPRQRETGNGATAADQTNSSNSR